MSLANGYETPVARVFNAAGTEVFERVTSFSYLHSELVDDSSRIVIETKDVSLLDHPDLQEGKILKLVFGYLGSKYTRAHFVWIWDTQPSFTPEGIRLEIVAYCKAAYMKLNSSKDVFNDSTLEDVAENIAAANGLKLEKENVSGGMEIAKTGAPTNSVLNVNKKDAFITAARDNTSYVLEYPFKKYEAIPQKNSSDAKLLDELAKNEPIDNFLVEGRDDRLIIKRRNLRQKPFKSYTYLAEPGYLLDFTPAIRNTTSRKNSVSSSVSGWDEEAGEFFQSSVGASQSNAAVLGDEVEVTPEDQIMAGVRSNFPNNPFDQTRTVDGLFRENFEAVGENGEKTYKKVTVAELDSTKQTYALIQKKGTRNAILDFTKHKYSAAMDATGRIDTKALVPVNAKEYISLVDSKPTDAAGAGVNRQSAKAIEINESSAKVLGDPELQSGKIISIMNVGKKHSGNYYVVAVEHMITPNSGYVCQLKIFKNGKNKVSKDDQTKIDASELGLNKNKEVALPFDGTSELAKIPVRKD